MSPACASHEDEIGVNESLITTEEAMKEFKVSRGTLYRWKNSGSIPSFQKGRKLYFKKSEILIALRKD
jgi:excisionase family DNA binding protein